MFMSSTFECFQVAAFHYTAPQQDRHERLVRLGAEASNPEVLALQAQKEALCAAFRRWIADTVDSSEVPKDGNGRLHHVELGRRQGIRNALARQQSEPDVLPLDLEAQGIANLLSVPRGADIRVYHLSDC